MAATIATGGRGRLTRRAPGADQGLARLDLWLPSTRTGSCPVPGTGRVRKGLAAS